MEQHKFKVIYSPEEDSYRIIDLTDSSIVGVTEMLKSDNEYDRGVRAFRAKEIKAKIVLGVKIAGYGIFILLDKDNSSCLPKSKDKYVLSVLRQMAAFFQTEVVDMDLDRFSDYVIPRRTKCTSKQAVRKKTDEKTPIELGWAEILVIVLLILLGLLIIVFIVFFIVSSTFREKVLDSLLLILSLPFALLIWLSIIRDAFFGK